ncbi:MAG: hypothetical protein U0V75_04915 [Ferruginibacter sp.]
MTKRKFILLISACILLAAIIFIGQRLYYVFHEAKGCNEDFMMDRTDRYLWLFDSSKTSLLKCDYPLGNDSAKKYRFIYTYKNQFRYLIVEDASLNNISLDKITDTLNSVSSSKVYINPSEVNDWYGGGHIYFQSKLCIDLSNRFLINSGEQAIAVKNDTLQTLYFDGLFKNVLLQNENYENQYLIRYDKPTQTTILFYKPKKILYLIVINPIVAAVGQGNGIDNLSLK